MINCPTCEKFDGHDCELFGRQPSMAICPYAVEKEKKPMLDLDSLEVGFYAKGIDGNFYKVDLPVDFPVTKVINITTGEIRCPNNYEKMKSMSPEELAEFLEEVVSRTPHCKPEKVCTNDDSCIPCWLEWLKEEVKE